MKYLIPLLFVVTLVQAEPLKVAVTHPFYAEWVEQIGGEDLQVLVLSEDDTSGLQDAAILYETGLGQEPWLEEAIESSDDPPRRVVLTDGMKTMQQGEAYWEAMPLPHPNPEKMPQCCRQDAADTNAAWQALVERVQTSTEGSDALDPNVWYNPQNAQSAVLIISDTLYEMMPERREAIDRNTARYLEELQDLNHWIKSQIRNIPVQNRVLHTDGSFRYFAQQYGLIAPVTEGDDSSLQLKEQATVCACAPCNCDPCACSAESLTLYRLPAPEGHEGEMTSYVGLMRYNTGVLVEALSSWGRK